MAKTIPDLYTDCYVELFEITLHFCHFLENYIRRLLVSGLCIKLTKALSHLPHPNTPPLNLKHAAFLSHGRQPEVRCFRI